MTIHDQPTELSAAPSATPKDPQFAYTLARGLDVLRAFDASSPLLSCREIAQRIGIARPTVVRLVRTLVMEGYLKPAEATARYRLAPSVLSFAYPLLVQLNVRQIARKDMQQLADFAKGAVSMAMRSGINMVIVESCMDNNALTGRPDLGALRPIASTALGGAYYSAASPLERADIRQQVQGSDSAGWPAVADRFAACEAQFSATGYCTMVASANGIRAVAAPMRSNIDGELLVMNCAVAPFNLDGNKLEEEIAPRLLNLVRSVEIAIGTGSTHNTAPLRSDTRVPSERMAAGVARR